MTVFKYKNGKLIQVAGNGGGSSGSTTPPDAELSETSENAVQNKVVTTELNKKLNVSDIDNYLSDTSKNPVQNYIIKEELDKKADWYLLNDKVSKDSLTLVNLLTGDINSNATYTFTRPVTDFTFICLRFKWTNGYGSDFLTIPSTACLNYNTEDARMVASTDAQYFAFYFPNASSWVSPNRSWGCFVQIYGIL